MFRCGRWRSLVAGASSGGSNFNRTVSAVTAAPARSYRISRVCRAAPKVWPPPPPTEPVLTAKQKAIREAATKQFFAGRAAAAAGADPATVLGADGSPIGAAGGAGGAYDTPLGYGASASPISASDEMDSSFAISRKGLLKNAKPFYQIDPAPAHVIKSTKTPLVDDIYYTIKVKGPLNVSQYMTMCLGHPSKGYYMNPSHAGRIFGRSGDFVTNPDVSQLFSEMLCVWVVSIWEQLGKPKKLNLVELGPGRGTMMHDILAASKWFQEFQITVRVHLVENSPILREAQYWSIIDSQNPAKYSGGESKTPPVTTARRPAATKKSNVPTGERKPAIDLNSQNKSVWAETKYGVPVEWHWHIGTLPKDGPLVVLAHEFFDALPVHQFQYTSRGWCERLIDIDNETGPHHLRWVLSPGPSPASWHYMMKRDIDSAFTPLPPSPVATIDTSNLANGASTASATTGGASMPFTPKPAPKFDIVTAEVDATTSASNTAATTTTTATAATATASAGGGAPSSAAAASNRKFELSEAAMVERLLSENPRVQDTVEVGAVGMTVMEDLTLRIAAQGGAALIIDYGADHPLPRSLQGIKKHARADILSEPGEVDLSAHVNFNALRRTALTSRPVDESAAKPPPLSTTPITLEAVEAEAEAVLRDDPALNTRLNTTSAIAAATSIAADHLGPTAVEAAAKNPLATARPLVDPTPEVLAAGVNPLIPIRVFPVITQREFLREMGIQERLKFVLDRAKSNQEYESIMSGFNRLTGDDESTAMGSLFKVLTIAHTKVGTPYGFHLAVDRQSQAAMAGSTDTIRAAAADVATSKPTA